MLQTLIAKAIAFVRRIFAPAMLPLLPLFASANAEAQTEFTPPQTTIHIKANITRETDNRPSPYRLSEITMRFSVSQIVSALTACDHVNMETMACRADAFRSGVQPPTGKVGVEPSIGAIPRFTQFGENFCRKPHIRV